MLQQSKDQQCNKATDNITPNGENLKAFLPMSGKNSDAHAHHFIQLSIRRFHWCNQARLKREGIQTVKEEKLSLFADDMTLHIENPKDFTKETGIRANK